MKRVSVRSRLLVALALLAVAVLTVGVIAWGALTRGNDRMDRLLAETLTGVDSALTLSQQAADLATLAPYLLTLESPFRIAQEGQAATALVDELLEGLPTEDPLRESLGVTREAIAGLVRDTSLRAGLRDRTLRLNAELAVAERRYAAQSARATAPLQERQDWLVLQRTAAALLGAGRAENLVGVGEFQREYTRLTLRLTGQRPADEAAELDRMRAIAEGSEGLFELRRLELARQIGAEAALVRIRRGAAAVTAHAAAATTLAQAAIAAERASTTTAIALAKSTLLVVVLASAALALVAALYVSGYVTANLRAISDAMIRLAAGDRQTKLPRGEGQGDEIGKLFHAFRTFRANALRLDRSHRQMAQRTALYENMMAGISDGVAILSDQGQIVAQNARLAPVLRVDPARLSGRPRLADVVAEAGWQPGAPQAGVGTLSLGGGHHTELRESSLPKGGSVVLISDATERRQLEDRLRQIQRIEALGKVSGEVAHDFGNILSTISGSLHLMDTAPPERQAMLRQTIASAVDLGGALTGRLLAFARRQHLEPELLDLPGLVDGLVDLVSLALSDRVELVVHVSPTPLPVRVDPGQMESAILNLCLNAGQAIAGAGRVTLTVSQEDDQAVIEVADTGAGMPPDVLAHAMEPFFTARADGTGTGLGLAMVYGFIRQSDGDIAITSAPGEGTTVRLTLPLSRGGQAPLLAPALATVLLVEDDAADRKAAIGFLTPLAETLLLAGDSAEALLQMSDPVALIVTDLTLGGRVDGWRLAETALTRWPEARAIVVSGHLPQVDPLSPHFPGRIATLHKPLTADALSGVLFTLFRKPDDANAAQR
ncbi:MAG: ATP-binding protein [Pseudotabrizicola sp.]|uniref:ATP-binding protein n=1 Tax=Pseudotabrizicola sp. TaxID=2939647 RepID=UPI00272342EE|nr:ATP-binding protein [Pseudotabrizicola sp.]MDO8884743.1 ATP-binding protein [Pseudotabrizicola sp.]MDP2082024.1 ATP-binding protein [Pseudotabrizicola sp.]MDZ7575629.1 ATP-binding protein [Pseudotabrizicola sp.]